jgi:hypothetical protein
MNEQILQHFQNWQQHYETEDNILEQQNQESENNDISSQVINENLQENFTDFTQDLHTSVKVYENDQIQVFVKKTFHQRQKKFRLEDSMYHIKIKVKENATQPLLFNLLNVFERVFTFILQNIRTFFNPNDINKVYLTLFQSPMVNGLNSPAVRLQDDPKEVVQRILDMLFRFLRSDNNIDLELNDTFTVYVHVLSIDHVQFKKSNPKPKATNRRKKIWFI